MVYAVERTACSLSGCDIRHSRTRTASLWHLHHRALDATSGITDVTLVAALAAAGRVSVAVKDEVVAAVAALAAAGRVSVAVKDEVVVAVAALAAAGRVSVAVEAEVVAAVADGGGDNVGLVSTYRKKLSF